MNTLIKLALLVAAFAAAVTTPLYIAHQTQVALREENRALRTQVGRLTALQAEHAASPPQRVLPAPAPSPTETAEHRELLRLRGQVGVLRDELAKVKGEGTRSAPPQGQAAPAEPANITYDFPSIPISQLLEVYRDLAGKPLAIAPEVRLSKTIWLLTVLPLTRTQAMPWMERALKDQGNVVIVTNDDGSLQAVPAPKP